MAAFRLSAPAQGLLPGRTARQAGVRLATAPATTALHGRGADSSSQDRSHKAPFLPLKSRWMSRFISPGGWESPGNSGARLSMGHGGRGNSAHNGRMRTLTTSAGISGGAFARAGSKYRSPPRVCIIGGGFGGLYTAVRLDSLMWPEGTKPQVTLIDQNDRFVFKPMLYEILNNSVQPWEVAPRFDKLLEPHAVRFIQGQVKSVEPQQAKHSSGSSSDGNDSDDQARSGGRVLLADGDAIEYDWLVLALGSDATPRGVPGARDLAIPFVNFDDAMKVRSHLEVLERGNDACVTIVGAGYAGVELAVAVAERLGAAGSVRLVTPGDDIMTGAAPGNRNAAYKSLSKLGVSVMTGTRVTSVDMADAEPGRAITRRVVKLKQGTSRGETVLEADLVLWTGGAVPLTSDGEETFHSKPPSGFPFPRNEKGATQTEATLKVVSHSRVFALGDTSFMQDWTEAGEAAPLPQTAQVAFQQADYVAWNLWASINNQPLLPFRYQHLGSMMSLGKTEGAVSMPLPVPPPISSSLASSQLGDILGALGVQVNTSGVTLEGITGGLIRRAAYLYRQPTNDHRVRVGLSWMSQAVKDAADMASTAGIGSLLGVLAGNTNRK